MIFTLIFGDIFSILAKCDRDENCTGILERISLKGPKFGVQWIFVYIDEEFAINGIHPKFLSLLMTGIFPRGMTELVVSKDYSQGVILLLFSSCV